MYQTEMAEDLLLLIQKQQLCARQKAPWTGNRASNPLFYFKDIIFYECYNRLTFMNSNFNSRYCA